MTRREERGEDARQATAEAILQPDLPIVDAHHHLMVRGRFDYLEDDLLADVSAGHRIAATTGPREAPAAKAFA